jgi:hypothetical protein
VGGRDGRAQERDRGGGGRHIDFSMLEAL